jgi:hypothetical protein
VKEIQVTTQAELEQVCKGGNIAIVRAGSFTAYGSSQVTACDSSQVRACDSSQVTACDSSRVTACDSSQVRAYGSSQVRACDSSRVKASKFVAVTVHNPSVKVVGGKVIVIRIPRTTTQWCAFYGLTVKSGVVTLFKAVDKDFRANHNGFDYTPGTIPVAPDWDCGKTECGGGLHFSPRPFMALKFNNAATKFVACPVKIKDIRKPREGDVYPDKVKARGCCDRVWECDIDGNKVKAEK